MAAETTLCTVIEAGYLEQQVLLLAESLRRFGGRRSEMPLVAVRPRKGPRVSRSTAKRLSELNISLVEDEQLNVVYDWWATMNKPAALWYVEQRARTANVSWIDGDMMVLQEPSSFAPPEGYDFMARAGEACDVASNGRDGKDEFWRRLCAKLDLDFDAFPEIISYPEDKPIKAYWQAGLFTYPRASRFSQHFFKIKAALLDGDVASKAAGTYHTDQVALALAVQAQGFRAAQYHPKMNFNVTRLDPTGLSKMPITEVEIMQYHSSLWPKDYGWTRSYLEPLPRDRIELLERYAPLSQPGLAARLARRFYEVPRRRKIRAYESRAIRY